MVYEGNYGLAQNIIFWTYRTLMGWGILYGRRLNRVFEGGLAEKVVSFRDL
jgi:hypothetical protein